MLLRRAFCVRPPIAYGGAASAAERRRRSTRPIFGTNLLGRTSRREVDN